MSTIPEVVVGIDLGGTNVRAGVLDAPGQLLAWQETPIEAARGPQAGIERIGALVERVLAAAGPLRLRALGIGSTGPVDREKGHIQNPYTLPGWEDVDVLAPLSDRFGVPATIENDADAAILGEYWRGAGRDVSRLYMVTVGTGIGTALAVDGRLYRGADGFHPEGGHSLIDPSGPECYCGAHGCWESLASGTAIARLGQQAAAQGGLLAELCECEPARVDAGLVAKAAGQGDPAALAVLEQAGAYLGLGLVNVISFFYPQLILLGGGIMRSYRFMEPAVRATLARHNVMVPLTGVKLALAELGGQAGVIGAGYAAWQIVNEQT